MNRINIPTVAISFTLGLLVGGGITWQRLSAPWVTLAEAELVTKNLSKEQVDAVVGMKGRLTSSGVGGDNYIWQNSDGSNLTIAWSPQGQQLIKTPDRLR